MSEGVRLNLLLHAQAEDEIVYRGSATLASGEIALEVTVRRQADRVVAVCEAPGASGDERARLEQLAAALVRAAAKSALGEGERAPRRIQRWRQYLPPVR